MRILDIRVDNISMNETLERAGALLIDREQHYIVTPNPEIIIKAQKDVELKNVLNKADLAIPDGFGLILASKFLGESLKERVTGADLMREICIDERFKNYKIFLLGGQNGVAKLTIKYFLKIKSLNYKSGRFYNSNLEYGRYNWEENLNQAVESINRFQPDILFIALGAPKQEKWIAENLAKIPSVKLAMTVGGAFNFLSGRIKRAPVLIQKLGLEWLWRLFLQPWRWKRIYNAVIIFPGKIIYSYLSGLYCKF